MHHSTSHYLAIKTKFAYMVSAPIHQPSTVKLNEELCSCIFSYQFNKTKLLDQSRCEVQTKPWSHSLN